MRATEARLRQVGREAGEGQSAAEAGRLGLLEVGVRVSGCQLLISDPCRCGNINFAIREACNKCQVSKEEAQDDTLR